MERNDSFSNIKTKSPIFFPEKSISGIMFFFGNLATGHFSGKFFPKIAGSGYAGSNDTGLKSVSRPGAESIECQTDRKTERQTEYE
jgi:hypothetical protein